ncbi:MAG: VOC family protein [Gammaproteobacteria bacterium]|nr:VOC family protein [Gammaproteobacteria bacterium]
MKPRISMLTLGVSDLDRAVQFYQQRLGFDLQMAAPEHGYASFAVGSLRLGIAAVGPEQAGLVGRHTGVGLAVDDLLAEHARLAAEGVQFSMAPAKQPWGGFMALMDDPDGNVFYLDQVADVHG